MSDRSITDTRIELAESALYEITWISQALRNHIAATDGEGNVEVLARGMLARVQQLSETAHRCLSDERDLDERAVHQIVHCRPRV
jgi:hypothetical protein